MKKLLIHLIKGILVFPLLPITFIIIGIKEASEFFDTIINELKK